MAADAPAIGSLKREKCGLSFDHTSTDQAEQYAMREFGSHCGVVLRFSGECVAYASDKDCA